MISHSNQTTTCMIQARNIHKSYDQLEVLKGVDMEVAAGQIVSIVGKSGAGKSTLLHILGTLDNADSGEIIIDGQAVHRMGHTALAGFRNRHIGFVFQFHHLLPEFTAVENVTIPAMIAGNSGSAIDKRAKELLDYLGLVDRMHHKPGQLSGGEQQRVAMARALMNEPAVVFADEPTGNLDTATSQQMHRLLLQLRNDFNQTFVIVTHNQDLADLSDRRLYMQDGIILHATDTQAVPT